MNKLPESIWTGVSWGKAFLWLWLILLFLGFLAFYVFDAVFFRWFPGLRIVPLFIEANIIAPIVDFWLG